MSCVTNCNEPVCKYAAEGVLNLDATARGPGWKVSRLQARETGLEDWLSGKAGNARADVQWETEVDNPWSLLKATPFGRWADGEAIGRTELSGSGAHCAVGPRHPRAFGPGGAGGRRRP